MDWGRTQCGVGDSFIHSTRVDLNSPVFVLTFCSFKKQKKEKKKRYVLLVAAAEQHLALPRVTTRYTQFYKHNHFEMEEHQTIGI